jgi:AhpC/TSA family protein
MRTRRSLVQLTGLLIRSLLPSGARSSSSHPYGGSLPGRPNSATTTRRSGIASAVIAGTSAANWRIPPPRKPANPFLSSSSYGYRLGTQEVIMLEIGSTVPDLALQDTEGGQVSLADYRGKENVLLYLMRSANCPVCNTHVRDLAGRQDELGAHHVRVLVAVPEESGSILVDRRGAGQRDDPGRPAGGRPGERRRTRLASRDGDHRRPRWGCQGAYSAGGGRASACAAFRAQCWCCVMSGDTPAPPPPRPWGCPGPR